MCLCDIFQALIPCMLFEPNTVQLCFSPLTLFSITVITQTYSLLFKRSKLLLLTWSFLIKHGALELTVSNKQLKRPVCESPSTFSTLSSGPSNISDTYNEEQDSVVNCLHKNELKKERRQKKKKNNNAMMLRLVLESKQQKNTV